jgi:acyl-coenzyme A thioesterase PaaI-like protein
MFKFKWTPRRLKLALNLYPPYLGAGIRVTGIRPDWSELRVRMKLRWYNRNAVGTHFGGSLYSMVDPHLMLLLMQRLGGDYFVWDQAAHIEFSRPGTGTVAARLAVSEDELELIREKTAAGRPFRPTFAVEIHDERGDTVATVTKTLYVKRKPGRCPPQTMTPDRTGAQ